MKHLCMNIFAILKSPLAEVPVLNLLPIKKKWVVLILSCKNCLHILLYKSSLDICLANVSPIYMLCGGILRTERLQLRRAGGAPRLESFIPEIPGVSGAASPSDLSWALSLQWDGNISVRSLPWSWGLLYVTPCSGKHHLATIHLLILSIKAGDSYLNSHSP